MKTCYRCAKCIKGRTVLTNPPVISVQLGIDFPKAFHPACYLKTEVEAAKTLWPNDPARWTASLPA